MLILSKIEIMSLLPKYCLDLMLSYGLLCQKSYQTCMYLLKNGVDFYIHRNMRKIHRYIEPKTGFILYIVSRVLILDLFLVQCSVLVTRKLCLSNHARNYTSCVDCMHGGLFIDQRCIFCQPHRPQTRPLCPIVHAIMSMLIFCSKSLLNFCRNRFLILIVLAFEYDSEVSNIASYTLKSRQACSVYIRNR